MLGNYLQSHFWKKNLSHGDEKKLIYPLISSRLFWLTCETQFSIIYRVTFIEILSKWNFRIYGDVILQMIDYSEIYIFPFIHSLCGTFLLCSLQIYVCLSLMANEIRFSSNHVCRVSLGYIVQKAEKSMSGKDMRKNVIRVFVLKQ